MSNASSRQQTPDIQPVIAELLRTCVHPPVLALQIDHVIRRPVRGGGSGDAVRHGYATKLLLTDGELLIQALLHRKLSTLPEIEDLGVGDIVEIHDFVVKKAKRKTGRGHVVYLGVENCYVIKKDKKAHLKEAENTIGTSSTRGKDGSTKNDDNQEREEELAGGFFRDEPIVSAHKTSRDNQPRMTKSPKRPIKSKSMSGISALTPPQSSTKKRKQITVMLDSDEDDGFETANVDMNTAKRRRQVLHELDRNIASPTRSPMRERVLPHKPAATDLSDQPTHQRLRKVVGENAAVEDLNARVADDTRIEQTAPHQMPNPLSQPSPWGPFQSLASLYSSALPAKSYVLTTLVVPTYVSSHLISRPNGPLPAKRHIKIIDISLASKLNVSGSSLLNRGITVSVFRDAINFKPAIGHAALLRGLVMQRLKNGEVILNVYPEKSRIQKQSQTRSQSQATNGSRPPSRHAHFADDPVVANTKREDEAHSLFLKRNQTDQMLKNDRLEKEPVHESSWFIDDHVKLRELGYDVDSMQRWWERNVST